MENFNCKTYPKSEQTAELKGFNTNQFNLQPLNLVESAFAEQFLE